MTEMEEKNHHSIKRTIDARFQSIGTFTGSDSMLEFGFFSELVEEFNKYSVNKDAAVHTDASYLWDSQGLSMISTSVLEVPRKCPDSALLSIMLLWPFGTFRQWRIPLCRTSRHFQRTLIRGRSHGPLFLPLERCHRQISPCIYTDWVDKKLHLCFGHGNSVDTLNQPISAAFDEVWGISGYKAPDWPLQVTDKEMFNIAKPWVSSKYPATTSNTLTRGRA